MRQVDLVNDFEPIPGYRCIVMFYGTHHCGYCSVPEGHVLHGLKDNWEDERA